MAKHRKQKKTPTQSVQLPKGAINQIQIGKSFAEYDLVRDTPFVFVQTPAVKEGLAIEPNRHLYVGRRGTGKTAMAFHIKSQSKNISSLIPALFDHLSLRSRNPADFIDTRQQPFKTLRFAFERGIYLEALRFWTKANLVRFDKFDSELSRERPLIEQNDFDSSTLTLINEGLDYLFQGNRKSWLRYSKRPDKIAESISTLVGDGNHFRIKILIDRIDDAWSGDDGSLVALMALLHASVYVKARIPLITPFIFVRENIFQRVESIDNEFARIETSVIPIEWTDEQLVELVERRINLPFHTRIPLGGETWKYFFEESANCNAKEEIFNYAQKRPRDVLLLSSIAIQTACSHLHEKVLASDVEEAKKKFSASRLKELGDEYSENYPHINLILQKFYGLGKEFSMLGVEDFIKRLLSDPTLSQFCGSWLFEHSSPHAFVQLLFSIGFAGIRQRQGIMYRPMGAMGVAPPAISQDTHIVVHPTYSDALALQDLIVTAIRDDTALGEDGQLVELPDGLSFGDYEARIKHLMDDLKTLPSGRIYAPQFEDIVGEVIKLCFFRALGNTEAQARDCEGTTRKDWICSNKATDGFWAKMRDRYAAMQVLWECKNVDDLGSADFAQSSYYISGGAGRLVILVFRGLDTKKGYYRHVRRISEKQDGLALIINQRDLLTFMRQAINGKREEGHISAIYDFAARAVA